MKSYKTRCSHQRVNRISPPVSWKLTCITYSEEGLNLANSDCSQSLASRFSTLAARMHSAVGSVGAYKINQIDRRVGLTEYSST